MSDPEGYATDYSAPAGGITFACPAEMKYWSEKVFSGEYDITYEHAAPVILDVGANCGAFALWARKKWPDAKILCYEPAQVSYEYLRENTKRDPKIGTFRLAVLPPELGKTKLYVGKQNQGEASFCEDLLQTQETYETPDLLHPSALPKCDILKLDTEGCEFEILLVLSSLKRLPEVILLEYHRESDRRNIDSILKDYILTGGICEAPGRGTAKYLRSKE